jgi:YD repeat-containing protein
VDVASGKVMTEAVDAELPGPLPLRIERIYTSSCASRRGPLGCGWSSSLDQAIWAERGKVVLLAEDGREIEFDTFDLPGHRMRPGQEVWQPVDRLTLRCEGENRWTVVAAADGTVREFAPVKGRADGRARLQRIRSRCGCHEIAYEYDARGRLEWASKMNDLGEREAVETSLGAHMSVLHDTLGTVEALYFGQATSRPGHPGLRFERDAAGIEVGRRWDSGICVRWQRDALGRPLTRATESRREDAPSVKLEDRRYEWRGEDQIAAIIEAGREPTRFKHDELGRVIAQSSSRGTQHRAMDGTGNVYRSPDRTDRRYGPAGCVERADELQFAYDEDGNLASRIEPDGAVHRYHWNGGGLLSEVELPDGRRVRFEYDAFARRTRKLVARPMEGGGESVERDTRFVWDGHVVVHEVDRDEGVTTWFWEPGTFTPVAREKNGERWAVVSDHLGTPTEMYGPAGELAWKMQLDLFGVATFQAGKAGDCPWRWPGQYEDGETGLFYNWRRYGPERAVRRLRHGRLPAEIQVYAMRLLADHPAASLPEDGR